MSKELTIIDKDYIRWVEDLSVRYRQSQIKAAVRVNRELLKYYWELGRDIEESLCRFFAVSVHQITVMSPRYGKKHFFQLSHRLWNNF